MPEIKKEKRRLQNGWELVREDLTILVRDEDEQSLTRLTNGILNDIAAGEQVSSLPAEKWPAEIRRLLDIQKQIIEGYPETLDIFDYLPLTKKGTFAKNATVIVAGSKCSSGARYDCGSYEYPEHQTIQLRLVPYFESTEAWLANEPVPGTLVTEIQWYNTTRKSVPLFDEDNVPSKPDTTRAKYLKNSEILPGHVYEEKSGSQYLVLTGLGYRADVSWHDGEDFQSENGLVTSDTLNLYVRWTKKLQAALKADDSLNAFMHAMADQDLTSVWTGGAKMSVRQSPRKFVKHVCRGIDPSKTRDETFTRRPPLDKLKQDQLDRMYRPEHTVFRYIVRANPKAGEDA